MAGEGRFVLSFGFGKHGKITHTGYNARRRGINESIWSHNIMDTVYVPTLVSSGHSTRHRKSGGSSHNPSA
jgi:hypothetical protein